MYRFIRGVLISSLLVVGAAPALAQHRWHHHGHHRHHHRHRVERVARPHGFGLFGSPLVAAARRYLGTNPTGWRYDWCARFVSMILKQTGHQGGGNLALAYRHYGHRVRGPRVGAIAVMRRPGRALGGGPGGHVGVVAHVDANGNPVIISGNSGGRRGHRVVTEHAYPRGRIVAYVVPD